jgi:hypothetical protein
VRKLDRYEAKVCFKLYRQGCFGAGHRLIDTVTSGFPSHELDRVSDAIQRLIKDGILKQHPTKNGYAVNIHSTLKQEMYDTLRAMPEYKWLTK